MGVANALAVVITFCACQHAVAAPPSESWHQPEGGRTKVLYVLECEGPAEWQAVPVDEPVVNWIRELKDRLTAHIERPDGEDLTIPSWWAHREVQPLLEPLKGTEHMDARGGISMYNIVQVQLMIDATSVWLPKYLLVLYQMTMVGGGPAADHLFVTASKSFWQTVEASAANGRFIFKASYTSQEQSVPSIQGYAVLLPTILSVMYGQGEWPEESVSGLYGDHTAWDRTEILGMLEKFISITEAITLPDLQEYNWRSDKAALYDTFQKYYEQDGSTGIAPIPTAIISLPVNGTFHRDVCYAQRYVQQAVIPDADIRAAAAAMLAATMKLDSNPDANAIQQHNPDILNSTLRKYVLKRNHSGFARKVIQISLDLSNWQPDQSLSGLIGSAPHRPHVTQLSRGPGNESAPSATSHRQSSSMVADAPTSETCAASFDSANAMPEAPGNASPSLHESGSRGPALKPSTHDPLHDAQQMLVAAERILRESCGEEWLLQPFIPDMGSNEYRVNLIGGSQASGTATDTAAVFTPAKAANNQLYMYNLTLPHGFFSRAPIGATDLFKTFNIDNQYNSTKDEEYQEKYFPYPAWKEPAMHQLLVDVALAGAQAFIASERPARMSHNVLLRIDIALTQYGNLVRPFINEAHYYADATIMFPVWPPELQSGHEPDFAAESDTSKNGAKPKVVTGWGLWMAQGLWKEVQWRSNQIQQAM